MATGNYPPKLWISLRMTCPKFRRIRIAAGGSMAVARGEIIVNDLIRKEEMFAVRLSVCDRGTFVNAEAKASPLCTTLASGVCSKALV
ncbi:MAG: hypothetical protein J4G10_01955 [Alphaproteobacteria bacterium]|nr:hypothetical protein [Alphaproteobacteria bacterium]